MCINIVRYIMYTQKIDLIANLLSGSLWVCISTLTEHCSDVLTRIDDADKSASIFFFLI